MLPPCRDLVDEQRPDLARGDAIGQAREEPADERDQLRLERQRDFVLAAFDGSQRRKGRLLGRPKGSLGPSKLDGKEGEIRMLLEKEVSKASIAKIVGVSSTNLRHFIRTRKLDPKAPEIHVRGRRP